MEYAVLKLLNGDEIIAEILEDNKDTYKISQPVQIHRHMTHIHQEMVRCSYWLLFSKSDNPEVVIDKRNVLVYSGDINQNVVKHYEYFKEHAKYDLIDNDSFIGKAEQDYKKQMTKRIRENFDEEHEDSPSLRDLILTPANTTIH
jgi:hypothetical protein